MTDDLSSAQDKVDSIGGGIIQPVSQVSIPPFPPLRIVSLNARGLNNTERKAITFNESMLLNPSMLLLQETKIKENDMVYFTKVWKGPSIWSSTHIASKGVVTFGHKDCEFNPLEIDTDGRFTICSFKWFDHNIIIVNLYAPNLPNEQELFYQKVHFLIIDHLSPSDVLVIGGDFNNTHSPLDKIGGNSSCKELPSSFACMIEDLNLVDTFRHLYPTANDITWSNSYVGTRLDRFYIQSSHLYLLQRVSHQIVSATDHSAVVLDLKSNLMGAPKTKTMITPRHIFMSHLFLSSVLDMNFPNSIIDVIQILTNTAKNTLVHDVKWNQSLKEELLSIKEREKLIAFTKDNNRLMEIKNLKTQLYKISRSANQLKWQENDELFFKFGDKPSKFLSSFLTSKGKIPKILALRDNDLVQRDQEKMEKIAITFYKQLYSSEKTDDISCDIILSNIKMCLDPGIAFMLEQPITAEEVTSAIENAPRNKSPGSDDIPSEVWLELTHLSSVIAHDFNNWLDSSSIPDDINEGVINLLFKKDDPMEIKNYRPITLLNSIRKILSSIIVKRLYKHTTHLVSASQTAVPGRYIGSNIKTVQDLIEWCKIKNLPVALLLADQEKAFDRIEHIFIFKTLLKFGFSTKFIGWIKTLLSNGRSCIKINGNLTDAFDLSRGVRQGDPLSPYLFVLAMEPLIQSIENDNSICGIRIPNGNFIKSSAFADDLTLFASGSSDWVNYEKWMTIFSKASGARFNNMKCEALTHNFPDPPTQPKYFNKISDDRNTHTRFLGIPISFNFDCMESWKAPITKFAIVLKRAGKSLSLSSKTAVLRSYALPILNFHATFLPCSDAILNQVNSLIKDFLWSSKRSKVNMDTCFLHKLDGGISIPNFKAISNSLKAKWIFRILDDTDSNASSLSSFMLNNTNIEYGHFRSTLYCPGSKRDADRAIQPFWKEAIHSFWNLKPCLPDYFFKNSTLLRTIPLFNNKLINLDGKPLTGNKWKNLAKKGIVRVADVIFNNVLGSREQVQEFYQLKVSLKNWNELTNAIPISWLHTIRDNPWNYDDNQTWGYLDNNGSFNVADESVEKSLWRPFKMFNDRHVFLDTDDLPTTNLFKNLNTKTPLKHFQSKLTSPVTPKGQALWESLIDKPLQWKRIHHTLWKAPVQGKMKDLAWLILRRSLFTGATAKICNSTVIPHHCHCGAIETTEHIFLDCPASKELWNVVSDRWSLFFYSSFRKPSILSLASAGLKHSHRYPKWLNTLWQILYLVTIYSIWLGRCHNVYEGPPSSMIGRLVVNMRRTYRLLLRIRPDLRGLALLNF